jgi:hypothetical protein
LQRKTGKELPKVDLKDLFEEIPWEKVAKTRMGKYLTRIETAFDTDSITGLRLQMIMDVGGGESCAEIILILTTE